MGVKSLTISQLEEMGERGAIWVLNSAQRSVYELEGEILLNIPTAQGRNEVLKVPQTWLPYELTGKFPKQRILDATDFRNAVFNGLITIIPADEAERINMETGAREERARLRALEAHVSKAGAPRTISDANVSITNPNDLQGGNTTPVEVVGPQSVTEQIKGASGVASNGLKASFMSFFERSKTQDDSTVLNSVKNRNLSRRELRHLRDNLPNHPKTKQVIRARLVELKKVAA